MSRDDLESRQPFFGKWYLGERLGGGTFGSVYSIYHDEEGVRLYAAMKVLTVPKSQADIEELRTQGLSDTEIRAFFEKQVQSFVGEVNILRNLRGNDHIVCYEDHMVVTHRSRIQWDIFIRMERLERLDHYLKRIMATRRDVIKLWYDTTIALSICHRNSIIHRDIKPDNILVSREGYYKLVDFGIARYIGANASGTKAGTYPYMAPEVQEYQKYDNRADIYSLGIVIYQLLNANRYPFLPPSPTPFTATQRDEALSMRFSGKPIPPIPGLSPEVMKVILKSTAYNVKDRYSTAEELQRDILKMRMSREELASPLFNERGEFIPVLQKSKKKKPMRTALICFAVIVMLFALLMLLLYLK